MSKIIRQLFVYDFKDYKEYLRKVAGSANQRSGIKSQIARALKCQVSYLSRVLHKDADLSLEQGESLTKFLQFNDEDKDYFMLLLLKARAGSVSLKNYYKLKIENAQKSRLSVQNRLREKDNKAAEFQQVYYSSYQYALLHVACNVPQLRFPAKLADHFFIPLEQVHEVLSFLVQSGLLVRSDQGYVPTSKSIFIAKDNPLFKSHHSNLRLESIQSVKNSQRREKSLHYSAIASLSRADALEIKERLLREISACVETVNHSTEECVYGLGIDFFDFEK